MVTKQWLYKTRCLKQKLDFEEFSNEIMFIRGTELLNNVEKLGNLT